MKRFTQLATPWWIGGVILAMTGVLLARLGGSATTGGGRALATVAGQLLALGGLIVIALGVSRRVHRDTSR